MSSMEPDLVSGRSPWQLAEVSIRVQQTEKSPGKAGQVKSTVDKSVGDLFIFPFFLPSLLFCLIIRICLQ